MASVSLMGATQVRRDAVKMRRDQKRLVSAANDNAPRYALAA